MVIGLKSVRVVKKYLSTLAIDGKSRGSVPSRDAELHNSTYATVSISGRHVDDGRTTRGGGQENG